MPSLEELIEATGTSDLQPQAQPLNYDHLTNTGDVFSFIAKGLKESFTNGNRNNYCHVYAADANRFGISENETFGYLSRYASTDFTTNEIRQAVRSAYTRSNEFGTKQYKTHTRQSQHQAMPQAPPKPPTTKEVTASFKTSGTAPLENIFLVRTANQCIDTAKSNPIPPKLFYEFWHEGELSILFAGTGIGKTILGVQIADELSKTQKVLYFDFELSDKQFERRYSNNFTDHYIFSDNFLRVEINPDAENFTDEGLRYSIENTVITTGAKVVIVDNITYLKNNLETSKDALPLMKSLKQLKKKFNISILCLAHTPKRDQTRPITINDLSGSMMLANFADSVFAINSSARDKNLRYLKQIKARATEIVYDTNNVMVCEIRNDHNFTRCNVISFDSESGHLKEPTEKKKTETETAILEIRKNNPLKSYREIAKELGLSKSTVERIIKKQSNE